MKELFVSFGRTYLFPKSQKSMNVLRFLKWRHHLGRILGQFCQIEWFLKKLKFFYEKNYLFFHKKIKISKLWEIFSTSNFWDTFYLNFAKRKNFEKKSRLFFPESPSTFQGISNFRLFWEFLININNWNPSKRKMPRSPIVKKINKFFKFTHLFYQKAPNFEHFEKSRVFPHFEMHSLKTLPNLVFLKIYKDSLGKIHVICPKNPEIWPLRELKQGDHSRRILVKNSHVKRFEKIENFSKKTHLVFRKNTIIQRFDNS